MSIFGGNSSGTGNTPLFNFKPAAITEEKPSSNTLKFANPTEQKKSNNMWNMLGDKKK